MKVYVLLADKGKANPQAGTLDLLNAGWVVTGYGPMTPVGQATHPQAVAIFYEVELSRCNKDLVLAVELLTEDGQQVMFPQSPGGPPPPPLRVQKTIRVPNPGGLPTGFPGVGNTLIELMPGPIVPPGSYQWRVTLDGESNEDWCARFYVRAPEPPPIIGNPT